MGIVIAEPVLEWSKSSRMVDWLPFILDYLPWRIFYILFSPQIWVLTRYGLSRNTPSGVAEYPHVAFLQASKVLMTIKGSFTKFVGPQDGWEVQGVELGG